MPPQQGNLPVPNGPMILIIGNPTSDAEDEGGCGLCEDQTTILMMSVNGEDEEVDKTSSCPQHISRTRPHHVRPSTAGGLACPGCAAYACPEDKASSCPGHVSSIIR
eukprot:1562746-Pyramimonas_sp.AAC.1